MSDRRRTLRSTTRFNTVSYTEVVSLDGETAGFDTRITAANTTTGAADEDPPISEAALALYQFTSISLGLSDDDSDDDSDDEIKSPEELSALRRKLGLLAASDEEDTVAESSAPHLRPDTTRWTAESPVPVRLRHHWESFEESGKAGKRTKRRYEATCRECEQVYGGAQEFWLEYCKKGLGGSLPCKGSLDRRDRSRLTSIRPQANDQNQQLHRNIVQAL